ISNHGILIFNDKSQKKGVRCQVSGKRNTKSETLIFVSWDLGFVLRTPTLRAGSRFGISEYEFQNKRKAEILTCGSGFPRPELVEGQPRYHCFYDC
ncbi:MAG: hypothetical protein C0610_00380, partial [Desulfobacteraceae bacterium]